MADFNGSNAPNNLVGTDEDDSFHELGSGNDTVDGQGDYDWIDYQFDGGTQGISLTLNADGNGTVVDTFGDTDTIISVQAFDGTNEDDVFHFLDGADFFVEGHRGNDHFDLEDISFGTISYRWLLDSPVVDFIREIGLDIVGVTVDVATETVAKYNGQTDTFDSVTELSFRGTQVGDLFEGAGDGLSTYFEGMEGDDTIIGGDGYDFAVFRREGNDLGVGFTIDLEAGTATSSQTDFVDTLINIQNVVGTEFADVIVGDDDWNYLVGRGGDDEFFGGGGGRDVVAYWGHVRDDVQITGIGTGEVTVEDTASDWGTDTLVGVEAINFDDGVLRIDIDGHAGQVYRLYQAAYVREPDTGGLEFYINAVDEGLALPDLADQFVQADEFKEKYGEDLSDEQLIDVIYNNVLGRDADEGGKAFWLGQLAKPEVDAGDLLYFFSESDENIGLTAPAIEDGIWL